MDGKVFCKIEPYKYKELNKNLKIQVKDAYDKLEKDHDIMVIEGAGSCAEINLKENDIANMGMAKIADAPVILVGDIDRGGVFASLAGTMLLLMKKKKKGLKE